MTASLSVASSLLALLLASVGVVSYVVNRRRREVGIRMALGASARDVRALQPRDVRHRVVRQTFRPIAVGAVIGMAAASAASRALESVLFGISPFDPMALLGAALFLVGVAATAIIVPIRGALKVDPVTTLRYE